MAELRLVHSVEKSIETRNRQIIAGVFMAGLFGLGSYLWGSHDGAAKVRDNQAVLISKTCFDPVAHPQEHLSVVLQESDGIIRYMIDGKLETQEPAAQFSSTSGPIGTLIC